MEKELRDSDFADHRDLCFADLEDRLLHLCRHKLSGFIKVEKAFQKFFDPKMLEEILEDKADTKMVNELNRIKANYSDLAVTNSYIENLNERLK